MPRIWVAPPTRLLPNLKQTAYFERDEIASKCDINIVRIGTGSEWDMAAAVEELKAVLEAGRPTSSTVTTLSGLLGLEDRTAQASDGAVSATVGGLATKGTTARNAKSAVIKSKKPTATAVCEGASKALSGRDRFALATHAVNQGLKVLSSSFKSQNSRQNGTNPPKPGHPQANDTPTRALQPRSGNISPVRSSPKKASIEAKLCATLPEEEHSTPSGSSLQFISQCTQQGFAFLISADCKALGVREMPQWQLENGLLAFVGSISSHGMDKLAIRNLRVLKQRLERSSGAPELGLDRKQSRTQSKPGATDSISSLLHLNCDLGTDPAALSVAITYYQHAIRLVLKAPAAATIEELPNQMAIELPNGPVDLIIRHAKATKDYAKAAKQLENISQMLLRFGSSAAQSPEGAHTLSCPEAILRLQTIGLQIRKLWWKLAKHEADVSRELLQPFIKYAQAFVHCQKPEEDDRNRSDLLKACLKSIGPFDLEVLGSDLFVIHNLLCSQAASEGKIEGACQWAQLMVQNCTSLEQNHARSIAAQVRMVTCSSLKVPRENDIDIATAATGLQGKLTGSVADYEILVEAIYSLSQSLLDQRKQGYESASLTQLLLLGTSFCQRFARSYPGKTTQQNLSILLASLRLSPSTDDLVSWVSRDSAAVFTEAGALKGVTELTSRRPLLEVWSASHDSMSLSRILNTLLLKAARSNPAAAASSIFDDEKLDPASRGVILEWQLQCAADLASRSKYHESLKKLLPELLRRLGKVYQQSEFPIRYARSATTVLSIREAQPSLLPPHVVKVWQDGLNIELSDLSQDTALVNYLDDVKARHATLKLFSDGHPSVDDLRPHLQSWRRIVLSCGDRRALHNRINDPGQLQQQLRSIALYLRMLGNDGEAIEVNLLITKLSKLLEPDSTEACTSLLDLGLNYLDLGYSEKVFEILEQHRASEQQPATAVLQHKILRAEYLLSIDQLDKARAIIDEISSLGSETSMETMPREHRRAFEIDLAQSWLLSAQFYLATGSARESLHAGKRAVQILNGIWSSLERATGFTEAPNPSKEDDKAVTGLAKGISKLQLTPTENDKSGSCDQQNKRGAAFWPLVPVLMRALLHLSDVYTYHGLFNEADYYSQRAVTIAESVGSIMLLSRVLSHRCRLLTIAGRLEEAELCIVQDGQSIFGSPSLAYVERVCAKASTKEKEGDYQNAVHLYEEAENIIDQMNAAGFLARLEGRDESEDGLMQMTAALTIKEDPLVRDALPLPKVTGRKPINPTAMKAKAGTGLTRPPRALKPAKTQPADHLGQHFLLKFKSHIAVEKAMIKLQLGGASNAVPATESQIDGVVRNTSRAQLLRHRGLVQNAIDALETNVTLGLLAESTLSCPGLVNAESGDTQLAKPSAPTARSKAAGKAATKAKAEAAYLQSGPEAMLVTARNCLSEEMAAKFFTESTVNAHTSYSLLSNVALLASAFATNKTNSASVAISEAMGIDYPRIKALELEQGTITRDVERSDDAKHITWPEISNRPQPAIMSRPDFQKRYVDILPDPWTAVSICLSDDGKDLFIARYRAGCAPFTLKLPFARHKPGDDDDIDGPAFDYHQGKAELQDIIETSNYTCHNPGNLDAKGAKSKWWKEREELDRRLHELLINIENIWFGGFKSIFATVRTVKDSLARFRATLEQILARYIPSRQTRSENTQNFAFDDEVLGLFIGLENSGSMAIDIDEQVTDLLYFVVDLLQFRGERNAYDEIDFDSMTIDVVDAIQAYHEASTQATRSSQHLILVLDRRLQAFPWESLPCLEGRSVSRVGSMLSLRQCILSMRQSNQQARQTDTQFDGCHMVSRKSGTYILNPSSDLSATQTMLEPSLATLQTPVESRWSSIVTRTPNEDEFSSALTTSSVTLYFGHGAGSQYIRPRTIKRLQQCSEVVWLMGCSSGAVWENGDLEPCAVPLSYLLAGGNHEEVRADNKTDNNNSGRCLSVVAALWDVTDKDIDRFSLAIGEDWGLWPASTESKLPAKTPRKREAVLQPSTPVQVPKTPKTPRTRKTPAIGKTPATARSKPRRDEAQKLSLAEAVARCRDVCTLRYLNGAAPVVYGVPVYLET